MTRSRVGGERGSVLLCALVLLFVLTIMGVALFDTALIDAQLAQHSVDDIRALESAQAGLQRALYRLYLDLCGTPTCANPPVDARWDDGDIAGQPVAVSTGAFAAFIGTATSFAGAFKDPRGEGFPEELQSGAYSVRLKHLTKGEAKLLGVACLDGDTPDSTVCPHVVYLRSTGTFGRPADEPTSLRVVQMLVRASSETFAAGNMALFGERVIGSPEVHGSVRLLPCANPPCTLTLNSGIGIRNNYNGLVGGLQSIIPLLPVVRCPGNTACSGMDVETLEGSVHIRKADTDGSAAVNIQWAEASVGQASVASNSATGNLGKPTMDRVDLGRGCAPQGISPLCSDVVGTNSTNVYADRPIRSDDRGHLPKFPEVNDPAEIRGTSYASYAACSPGTPPTCDAGSTGDFFIAHAFKIVPGSGSPEEARPSDCDGPGPLQKRGGGVEVCVVRSVFDILSGANPATPWNSNTATFRYILRCAPAGPTACGSGPTRVNGAISGSPEPAAFMLEWRGSDWEDVYVGELTPPLSSMPDSATPNVLVIYQCSDVACTNPTPFTPTAPVIPVMIYVHGDLKICPGCGGTRYQGHGIFLAQGDISIDTHWGPLGTIHSTFPDQNLFTFYTPRNISVGTNRTVMGRFYAGSTFQAQTASHIVGGVSARVFELQGTPEFWQVKMPATVTALPGYGPQGQPARPSRRWDVREIHWKECAQRPVPAQPC